jgi:hypothetical protein
METLRVDIAYRPLRIGLVIKSGDVQAFREAVRLSHTLWGGRFNPIMIADRENEARRLVDLFRVDFLLPVGDNQEVKDFPKKFPYLINPLWRDTLFTGESEGITRAKVLDVHNALVHMRDSPARKALMDRGFNLYNWQPDDPLADVFLMQFGAYPDAAQIGIDYRKMVKESLEPAEIALEATLPIPADTTDHPSIAYLSRHGIQRHYSVHAGWSYPGFFVGNADNLDDLICHWNLLASDIPLFFVDSRHLGRYSEIIPPWEEMMRESLAHRHEWERRPAVWTRGDDAESARTHFPGKELTLCSVSEHTWNGRNVRPPMMHFDQVSVMGVLGRDSGQPKVSFPLSEKPFCGDTWFHTQHLVASVSFLGGLYDDDHYTLHPPYLPELNEFCARTMHFEYSKLRLESERVGIVIDAADTDAWLKALPIADLVERIFRLAGYQSKLSNGGLITRQLIARVGGLQGARAFKIHGVRRLIKTHGPTVSFTKRAALQLIGDNDPKRSDARFSDHSDLYFDPRPVGDKLTPPQVFSYLVKNGLFRMGHDLACPNCRLPSWIALDNLKQKIVCELCGEEHDATGQLIDGDWAYRRSSILGIEKNAMGAIPVALTLQQLDTTLSSSRSESAYSLSLNLTPDRAATNSCEVDFAWIIPRPYPRRTAIILGECKDVGPVGPEELRRDIETLVRIANALPAKRFKTFLLISKLSPFTADEIECAKALNTQYKQRAILLTARELEPYHIFERTKEEFDIDQYAGSPEDLAEATAKMYFSAPDPAAVSDVASDQGSL